jgi:hypothetical protein
MPHLRKVRKSNQLFSPPLACIDIFVFLFELFVVRSCCFLLALFGGNFSYLAIMALHHALTQKGLYLKICTVFELCIYLRERSRETSIVRGSGGGVGWGEGGRLPFCTRTHPEGFRPFFRKDLSRRALLFLLVPR